MANTQFKEMKKFCEKYSDEPDGAFFALADDIHGWRTDDWVWYSEQEQKLRKKSYV